MLLRKIEKNKIIGTVCAALPVALLLACGAVRENSDKVMLLEKQEASDESAFLTVESRTGEEDEAQAVFVHICGEVAYPGVYEVPKESRLCDVLLLAGGFTEAAAMDSVNLAGQVSDGMQVVIPSIQEVRQAAAEKARERDGLLNLNTATKTELCTLSGIGESRAAAIIAYREAHGGFSAVEEIMQVEGIKSGTYEKLKDRIYVE
ncbi:MAG: helix-hairpin-helix domain-containing protein [Lachnospiraceae bacterium]